MYWSSVIKPYMGKRVLEVGAGIGNSTRVLARLFPTEVHLCLEPDPRNIEVLQAKMVSGNLPEHIEIRRGTLASLEAEEEFDTILYVDVLEHIEDDQGELARAAQHLEPNGHLIILAPAYPSLYSEFDKGIGHYRRYVRSMFAASYAGSLRQQVILHLDSLGLLVSLGNRLFLRSAMPTPQQLTFWDRRLVPISRIIDKIIRYRLGRSILAIYSRQI
jgi:SAM-dependent methyltransferase